MQLHTVQRFCDEINALGCGYFADIVHIEQKYHSDFPAALRIRHAESGNEIRYAGQNSEAKYMTNNIKDRFRQVGV